MSSALFDHTSTRKVISFMQRNKHDLSSRSWPPAPRGLGYSMRAHSVLRRWHRPLRTGALRGADPAAPPPVPGHTGLSLPPDPALAGGLCFASRPATQPLPNSPFRRVPAPATPLSHYATPLTSSLLRHSNLATPFVHLPAPPRHAGSAPASSQPRPRGELHFSRAGARQGLLGVRERPAVQPPRVDVAGPPRSSLVPAPPRPSSE